MDFQIVLQFVLLIVPSRGRISEGNQIESNDLFHRRRLFRFCHRRGCPWRGVPKPPLPPGESSRDYGYTLTYKYGEVLRQRQ